MLFLIKPIIRYCSETAKVLIMSGTHGNHPGAETESGASGLTDRSQLTHHFYKEDCQLVGVKAGPARSQLPLRSWDGIPIINKPAEKREPPPPGSFYNDEDLCSMDFRMGNMSNYHGHEKKLVDDINEVKSVRI